MEKVILITSRLFDDKKDKDSETRLKFSDNYLELFLFSYDDQKGIACRLRKYEVFRKWFEKDLNDGGIKLLNNRNPTPCDEVLIKNLNNIAFAILEGMTADPNDEFIDEFIKDIESCIRNTKKSEGKSFHAGVFKIGDDSDNHIKVYLAEEYPFLNEDVGVFSKERARYLDALVGMVIDDVKAAQKEIDSMLILSHDADWGKSFETAIIKLDFIDNDIMPNLVSVKNKVKVYCFQHDDTGSKIFNTIQNKINDPKNLFEAFDGLDSNVNNFSFYLESGEKGKLDNVDFSKAYLPDVPCPEKFDLEKKEL